MQIVKLWRVVLTTSLVCAAPRYFRSAGEAQAAVDAACGSAGDVSIRYAIADQSEPVRVEA